ncbi:MAG: PLP-dependent aspartate aminotransferase family protein [Pseudomonadota bacterium]|nr:PLP-dependent aspartate aminotransferase family protein [Pseudomonadota bacterium]
MTTKKINFSSMVIHAGQEIEVATGAVIPPIYATSTFAQQKPGEHLGYEYSRSKNPTRLALEKMMAALEEGVGALAFASGMAAIAAVLDLLEPGDHIVVNEDIYGGTWRLFEKLKKYSSGLNFTYVDMCDLTQFEQALTSKTKMVWLETPSNPMMRIIDIEAITSLVRSRDIISVVDNTFATPYIQKPLNLGADIVVHSVTKFLNGHSDVIGGMVISKAKDLCDKLAFIQNSVGAILGPFDSFLVLRGIKTLALRMQKHCENTKIIADYLSQHPKVKTILYPGLQTHPQHEIAAKQMQNRFGGVLSFCIDADLSGIKKFLQETKLFTLAESLGGVESLIEHPNIMTHASLEKSHRDKLGITDSLVRISVGIEDANDLISDLDAAFKVIT